MHTDHHHYVERWRGHVFALAEEIGPRGSTTEEERQASEYCEQVLERLGLAPQGEPFSSARSIYHPHLLAAMAMLVAFAIYPLCFAPGCSHDPLAGRVSAGIAALLSLVALVSDLMELSFRDNPLRRLVPKGPSQNVIAWCSRVMWTATARPSSLARRVGYPSIRALLLSLSSPSWRRWCSTAWGR
jgi:hypothetical protein